MTVYRLFYRSLILDCVLLITFLLSSSLANAQNGPPAFQSFNPSHFQTSATNKTQSQRAEEVEQMLAKVSIWMAETWNAQYPNEPFAIQPLTMGNKAFLNFVKSRFRNLEGDSHIGDPALSAFFEENGFVNGKPSSICYLLFNADHLSDLDSQFFLSPDSDSQMATAIFLVAHEFGHCLDRKLKTAADDNIELGRRNRWGEYGADLFSALIVWDATHNDTLLAKISKVREQGGVTHRTSPGLNALLDDIHQKKLKTFDFHIKDFWKLADNLRKNTFQ